VKRGSLILILSMFHKGSGSVDDYNRAIWYLPRNLSDGEYESAKALIAEYIGV
jgi:hypothetical protein